MPWYISIPPQYGLGLIHVPDGANSRPLPQRPQQLPIATAPALLSAPFCATCWPLQLLPTCQPSELLLGVIAASWCEETAGANSTHCPHLSLDVFCVRTQYKTSFNGTPSTKFSLPVFLRAVCQRHGVPLGSSWVRSGLDTCMSIQTKGQRAIDTVHSTNALPARQLPPRNDPSRSRLSQSGRGQHRNRRLCLALFLACARFDLGPPVEPLGRLLVCGPALLGLLQPL